MSTTSTPAFDSRLAAYADEIIRYRGGQGNLLDARDARWYAAEEDSLNGHEQDEVARIIIAKKGW